MTELVFALAFVVMLGIWELLKLVWMVILWATRPIRDELAYQRVVNEERQKEEKIVEAHREAVQQIDNVVGYYQSRHEQALGQADDEARRRESGPSS